MSTTAETNSPAGEDALHHSEAIYRSLIQASNQVLYRHNADWSEMRQLAGGGFVGDTDRPDPDWFAKYIHPDDREQVWSKIQEAIRTKGLFELEHRVVRKDGTLGWTFSRSIPILDDQGEIIEWFGLAADITKRKRAEQELEEERHNLETLNSVGSALAGELDLERLVQMVTDAGVELTGAQFGAFFYNVTDEAGESYMLYTLSGVERSAFERFPMPRNTKVFEPTFAGERVVRSDDITRDPRYGQNPPYHGKPEGHLPVVSYLAVPVVGRSGEVIGGLFFGHPEPGCFKERHEHLMEGIAAQAAIAIDNARLFRDAQREIDRRVKAEQALTALNESLENRVVEEIERRSRAEEALRQSQKMETIGQLSGGIAHDFNNLLQIIHGNLSMLQQALPADQPRWQRSAGNALIGVERAASLTQRLLAFSRRQPLDPKPIDVNRLLGDMSELLWSTLGETIAVELKLEPGLGAAQIDRNQLESSLLNLALNARDAMPSGGTLGIETSTVLVDADYVSGHPGIECGTYIRIRVQDSGTGMDREVLSHAIEPFFTTKEVGQGTGLGLSMVYGFARQSGGSLDIQSESGRGTTVDLYLPCSDADAEPSGSVGTPPRSIHRGCGESVLVCEDDERVRAFSTETLRDLGYRIHEAADASAALEKLKELGSVDILFTDIVLPGGLNGVELAREARKLQPGLSVLLTSGYARTALQDTTLREKFELIPKPFSVHDLSARLRRMLARAS